MDNYAVFLVMRKCWLPKLKSEEVNCYEKYKVDYYKNDI